MYVGNALSRIGHYSWHAVSFISIDKAINLFFSGLERLSIINIFIALFALELGKSDKCQATARRNHYSIPLTSDSLSLFATFV